MLSWAQLVKGPAHRRIFRLTKAAEEPARLERSRARRQRGALLRAVMRLDYFVRAVMLTWSPGVAGSTTQHQRRVPSMEGEGGGAPRRRPAGRTGPANPNRATEGGHALFRARSRATTSPPPAPPICVCAGSGTGTWTVERACPAVVPPCLACV